MTKLLFLLLAVFLVFSLAACCSPDSSPADTSAGEDLAGGWSAPESSQITDELQALFDRATEGLLGVNYEPVALKGTQIVNGTNYCFLCRSITVYPGAEPGYSLVYIYQDLQGNTEVTEITALTGEEISALGELSD